MAAGVVVLIGLTLRSRGLISAGFQRSCSAGLVPVAASSGPRAAIAWRQRHDHDAVLAGSKIVRCGIRRISIPFRWRSRLDGNSGRGRRRNSCCCRRRRSRRCWRCNRWDLGRECVDRHCWSDGIPFNSWYVWGELYRKRSSSESPSWTFYEWSSTATKSTGQRRTRSGASTEFKRRIIGIRSVRIIVSRRREVEWLRF
jgi:hypothetical protein